MPPDLFHMEHSPLDAVAFAALTDVSRETLARFERYDATLLDWSTRHNLVARSTLPDRWRRHFLDSAQLASLLPPETKTIVDLGSGAGFPGLVLAALTAERGVKVFLIESTAKKAAFLAAAAEAMGLSNVTIINQRIENTHISPPDVITARALASLETLLELAEPLAGSATRCLFLKGQDVDSELTAATKSWNIEATRHRSQTAEDATILEVHAFERLRPQKGRSHGRAHPRHRQSEGRRR